MGDGDAVVGKRHPIVGSGLAAVGDLPLAQHAAAAVNHQFVGGQVLGKIPEKASTGSSPMTVKRSLPHIRAVWRPISFENV